MRNSQLLSLLCAMGLLLGSCNLSDFDLSRFTDPSGLNPVIYLPVASGTYAVKNYAAVPGFGSTPVTDSLVFNPISYSLNSMSINTTGTDSMVIIIKTVNETPMKYRYQLSFTGKIMDSGSKLLSAATINPQGDVIEASHDSLEFKLDTTDLKNLALATKMDLSVTLYQPDQGTVLANVLKSAQISFKIGFRAPINLFKVKL